MVNDHSQQDIFSFELLAKHGRARAGRLTTSHGTIETPAFVTVATLGAVESLSVEDLRKVGTQALIANAYHLHLRPGGDLVERMGGLHAFTGWDGPLLIDSGGFQIFSLGAAKEHGVGKIAPIFPEQGERAIHVSSGRAKPLVTVREEGAEFISYLDGSTHLFTPEGVMERGIKMGGDILLPLDECTSPLHDYDYTRRAMERTHRWALRALEARTRFSRGREALLGIVQGGAYRDLREESAAFMATKGFDGYAVGGSLGRSREDMHRVLQWSLPFLPEERPRHLLGIGRVEDVFDIVAAGIDLFDCVAPTRLARTGTLLTRETGRFTFHILNRRFREDGRPIEEGCPCFTCTHHSRGYLRHLFAAREAAGVHLAAVHNLHFMESLMGKVRESIRDGRFDRLRSEWQPRRG